MVIETWDVSEYNYIIVFILSFYAIGGIIYIIYNYKKKELVKVLIHFCVGAVIVLALSYMISAYAYKTVHIIYQYNNTNEIQYLVDRGWTLQEDNKQYSRAHLTKVYKEGRMKLF